MALQRKNGNVRRNDDEHGEHGGSTHFAGGVGDEGATLFLVHAFAAFSQAVHDVFHHDHGPVHDDAEIHRTQTQQVGRHAHDLQA